MNDVSAWNCHPVKSIDFLGAITDKKIAARTFVSFLNLVGRHVV